ncbi:MAG: DNA recombination protein RmuC [Oligoflexia bacterium]|nr:DNA recombination protein RmuC [Oligoflexia bacterium]
MDISVFLIIALGLILVFGTGMYFVLQRASANLSKGLEQSVVAQRGLIDEALSRNRMESRQNMQIVLDDLQKRIDTVRTEVDKKLSETVTRNFEGFGAVAKRLEELKTVTGEVVNLSQGVRDLSRILESPKLRGAMGEFQLGEMLKQILPSDCFEEQYALDPKSREQVDAVIKLQEGFLCIDSKFPLTSARALLETDLSADEKKAYEKSFSQDVKTMVDSIASKYIISGKTLDFAFMFIPAEAVYYFLLQNSELHQHCLNKKVIPVSPNSFYAYLQALAVGFRGMRIQAKAQKISESLSKMTSDFERLQGELGKLGKHLKDAQTQYGNVESRTIKMSEAVVRLGSSTHEIEEPEAKSSSHPQIL